MQLKCQATLETPDGWVYCDHPADYIETKYGERVLCPMHAERMPRPEEAR